MTRFLRLTPVLLASLFATSAADAQSPLAMEIDRRAVALEPKVVAWRRDIHQHPELSNFEVRTAKLVADHLSALGIEIRTGVARTGVVGVLKGGKPGPVVALRADHTVFERYQRRQTEVNQLIRDVFLRGVSTREVGRVLETMLGERVSAATVSRVARSLDAEVQRFHRQPFSDRWR
jgi:hypothetical protein